MIKTTVHCDDCLTKDTAYTKDHVALCQEIHSDKYPYGTIICGLCKGTKEFSYDRDESYQQVLSRCYNCKGKGYIVD